MDINGVCHIVFCGRLEACFRGQTVVSIAYPCSVLVKPCKSRTFQPLTVHSRPPFPFTFCFLPSVNSGGAVGAVFPPVGFGDEHAAADRTAFQIPAPVNFRFQRPGKGQDRPPKPFTADRERNHLRAGVGVPSVKEHTVPVLITAALPADQGVCLFPLCRCHAVKGTVLPALYGRQSFIWIFYHASLHLFSVAVLPEKASCPIPAECSGVGTLPITSGHFVPKPPLDILSRSRLLAVLPPPDIPFRTVILFSRCCPSMNYPKSTRKKCNPRNFARIAF